MTLEVRNASLPPLGMASRALTAQVDDDLLELAKIGLDRPEIAAVTDLELHLVGHNAFQHQAEIGEDVAQFKHLRAQRAGGARKPGAGAPVPQRDRHSA